MTVERPFLIGLTGSIGMGKSTTAEMFRNAGIPVWDADAAVARLYQMGGAAVGPMAALFPGTISDGSVSKAALREILKQAPDALAKIEGVVHPLVQADRQAFIANNDADIVVLDIPLLFETGSEDQFDMVVVVSTSAENQRDRVLARPGMTQERFEFLLSKQMDDAKKRKRTEFVVDSTSLGSAQRDVDRIVAIAKARIADA
jgi:dephospho-CoA kinase